MLLSQRGSENSFIAAAEESGAPKADSAAREILLALLFSATAVNYLDRAVLGVLKPMLDVDFGWTQIDYGWMVTAFQATYAVGYALAGRWIDRIGVRAGLVIGVTAWSFAAGGHALAQTVIGFVIARSLLGLAEGGFFPAAVKAVAEWFPQSERSLATGIFNSGANIGAILAPAIVPWVTRLDDGTLRAIAAVTLRDTVNPLVTRSVQRNAIGWFDLFRYRQTWAYVAGTIASAPIWWFYIFWAPDFFSRRYDLKLTATSLPLMCIFLVAGFGGIAGGWLSSFLLRHGWTLNAARKTAFLACGLFAVPVFTTPLAKNYIIAVALVALAAAAHCGYAANLYALAADTVPAQAVASLVGIGGMAGAVMGMFFAQFIARMLSATHNNYMAPFAVAASSYLLGLTCIHLLLPKLEVMKLEPGTADATRGND